MGKLHVFKQPADGGIVLSSLFVPTPTPPQPRAAAADEAAAAADDVELPLAALGYDERRFTSPWSSFPHQVVAQPAVQNSD
jgi:hypothetical protein